MSGSKLTRYGDLTSQQILAVDLLVLKHGSEMSYTEIAELVGVAVKTLERWRKIPEFQKEVRTRTIELMGESLPDVLATLTRKAIGGNNKSIELYLKTLGLLKQDIDITARPGMMLDKRSNEAIEYEIEELRRELQLDTVKIEEEITDV